MKRFGMMTVALMLVATMSFAQSVNDSRSMSFDKLSKYLLLDESQIVEVSAINAYFESQLGQPLSAEALCDNAGRRRRAMPCYAIEADEACAHERPIPQVCGFDKRDPRQSGGKGIQCRVGQLFG